MRIDDYQYPTGGVIFIQLLGEHFGCRIFQLNFSHIWFNTTSDLNNFDLASAAVDVTRIVGPLVISGNKVTGITFCNVSSRVGILQKIQAEPLDEYLGTTTTT